MRERVLEPSNFKTWLENREGGQPLLLSLKLLMVPWVGFL